MTTNTVLNGTAITANANGLTGTNMAINAVNQSSSGTAIRAIAASESGHTFGLDSQILTTSSFGSAAVRGVSSGVLGTTYGLLGLNASAGDFAAGVFGQANGITGRTYGVRGWTQSSTGESAGVYGAALGGGTQSTWGVWGTTTSTKAWQGGAGVSNMPSAGVFGQGGTSGIGVLGLGTGDNGSDAAGRVVGGGLVGIASGSPGADTNAGYFVGRVVIDNSTLNYSATSNRSPLVIWTANNDSAGFNSSGALFTPSDRNAKTGFADVDTRALLEQVLALPVTRWHYKNDTSTWYMGPTAQDFHAAFGLGDKDTVIHGVNADGVVLAAIQGLNSKFEAKLAERDALIQAQNEQLKELAELRSQVVHLKEIIQGHGFTLSHGAGLGLLVGVPLCSLAIMRRRKDGV